MKRKWEKWTEDRVQKFIEMYPSASWSELTEEFGLSKSSLMTAACSIGVKRDKCSMAKYTTEEDNIIIHMVQDGRHISEIHDKLPWRTILSLKSRIQKICEPRRFKWTDAENKMLINLYSNIAIDELIDYFPNRTRDAIIIHANKLGLKAYVEHKEYSEYENNFIRDNYLNMSDEDIGKALNRSRQSVKNHRNEMGIHRVQKYNINYESASVYVRRHIQEWKKESMQNCGFRCVVTGGRFDEIHHLVSLNIILEAVYKRLDLDFETFNVNAITEEERRKFLDEVKIEQSKYPLGVCLRKDIHAEFHNYYGYGNNTEKQFYEFVEKYYPNAKINIA